MSVSNSAVDDALGPTLFVQVVDACDRFEADFRAGRAPRLEDFLRATEGALRLRLFRELAALEMDLHREHGEHLDPYAYFSRFPEFAAIGDLSFPPTREGNSSRESTVAKTEPLGSSDIPAIPGYAVLSELGRGAMGVVYKARRIHLNRLCALKMILAGEHAGHGTTFRFLAEAEAVARLRHPNVVQIYEVGEVGKLPFFSLELLEGGTLADRLAVMPMQPHEAARLFATLARAVHEAHSAGIIHRDLKPSNILFDTAGEPKIADFGLAKRLEVESGQTITGQVMGTPSYMSPEQARGDNRAVGPPADVYALGAILYETLTGRPPFKGSSVTETLFQVAYLDPVAPSQLQPRVQRDLETICLKCLSKQPDRRYASARDLADDLDRYLAGTPIQARRTPLGERGVKWVRRHPTAATLTGLSVAVVVALAAAGMRYDDFRRARERREINRVAGLRIETDRRFFQAQDDLTQERWTDARLVLTNARTRIQNEPKLRDLHARAEALLVQAERGRADREARDRDRQRFDRFRALRDEALFHDTQFTGLDLPGNQGATREKARAALAVFADPKSGDVGTLPATFSAADQAECTEGAYELLLVLAEALDDPAQGLRQLDRAAKLYPTGTRAYHVRRAACLKRRGDTDAAGDELQQAERIQPASAFDHFLTGRELYKADQWSPAVRQFDAALGLRPGDFWSECLSAICFLKMQRFLEAKAALNACLQSNPNFAWLHVLRGHAACQIAVLAREVAGKIPDKKEALQAEVEGQFAAAAADFAQALALLKDVPNNELHYVLLHNRGLMWFQCGRPDEAEKDLTEAARLDSRRYQAYATLARVLQAQGKNEDAIARFTQAIERRPNWAPLYRARAGVDLTTPKLADLTDSQRRRTMTDLERAIGYETPGNPVLALDWTNRALLLHCGGRDVEALAACDAALALRADHAEAHRVRLGVLLDLKRYDDLIRSCDALLVPGKATAELYELRGLARMRTTPKDYPGAIEDVTKALALRPDWPPLLARRGWLYLATGATQLSLRDFERAVTLDPSSSEAHSGRGLALAHLGRHREAVADAESALRLGKPSDERASYNAARIYALAATGAASEIKRTGRDAVLLTTSYQDRAVALVRETAQRLPADLGATFLRDRVLANPELRSLARRLGPVGPAATPVRK